LTYFEKTFFSLIEGHFVPFFTGKDEIRKIKAENKEEHICYYGLRGCTIYPKIYEQAGFSKKVKITAS
jgi:hypothetical protein